MSKSKQKRKQQAAQQQQHGAVKKLKTEQSAATPVLPTVGAAAATAFEPKFLSTVVPEEDLEITVDTLRALVENPGLIKSKACKDLRTAVFEFRKACTTGFNAAGASTLNLLAANEAPAQTPMIHNTTKTDRILTRPQPTQTSPPA